MFACVPVPPSSSATVISPVFWFSPQGLLTGVCLPAATRPLWGNNGRRGPSLEAYRPGYRGGRHGGQCFWRRGCAMSMKGWLCGGSQKPGWSQEKAGHIQIKIQCMYVQLSAYVRKLPSVHCCYMCKQGVGILKILSVSCWLASKHGKREEEEKSRTREAEVKHNGGEQNRNACG